MVDFIKLAKAVGLLYKVSQRRGVAEVFARSILMLCVLAYASPYVSLCALCGSSLSRKGAKLAKAVCQVGFAFCFLLFLLW